MNPNEIHDLDLDPEQSNELGDHLVTTLDVLAEEIEAGDTPDASEAGGAAGMMGGMMGPDMALSVLKPLARSWAVEQPEEVLYALARLHLETGALLDHHAPERTPEELLDNRPEK